MKKVLVNIFLIFSIVNVVILFIPGNTSADDKPIYPDTINGYPVIFKSTIENTINLDSQKVILTILIKDLKLSETNINETRDSIYKYLELNPLPEGCEIEIYGGPGASKELYEKTHYEINEINKLIGPIRLGAPKESVDGGKR